MTQDNFTDHLSVWHVSIALNCETNKAELGGFLSKWLFQY